MKKTLVFVAAAGALSACYHTGYVRIADPACVAAQPGYVVNDDYYVPGKLGVAPVRCPMIWVPVEQVSSGSQVISSSGGTHVVRPSPKPQPKLVVESTTAGGGLATADAITVNRPGKSNLSASAGNVTVTNDMACTAKLGCIK